MKIFDKVFGKTNKTKEIGRCEMVSFGDANFLSWNGKLFDSDIVRSCVRPTANAIGKLSPKHLLQTAEKHIVNPDPNIRNVLYSPNELMGFDTLLNALAWQLELNNNAFAYLSWDNTGTVLNGIYLVDATSVELREDVNGDLYLKFFLSNGKVILAPYCNIIHLRKDYTGKGFFGSSPMDALKDVMEVINTTDQGIVKAIRNSAVVKWLLQFKQVLHEDDVEKAVKKFSKSYLNVDNDNGNAAATDPRYEAKQVTPENYVPNAAQMDRTTKRLYSFFNTNEKIVNSSYGEDDWNAYYEIKIEPVALQLSSEFTRKIFTRREIGCGNSIIFESLNLQYAALSTKLNLVSMVDRGAMLPNEWRKVLNLAPIEGGDKPIRRLDTAEVKNQTEREVKEVDKNGNKSA